MRNRTGGEREDAEHAAAMAGGSPGAALALASGATFEMDQLARRWVEGDIDRAEALAVADKFRGAEGQERFEVLMDRLISAVKMRALDGAPGGGHRWADLWERLQPLPERTAGLNLDRGDVLAGALADIRRVQAQQGRMG